MNENALFDKNVKDVEPVGLVYNITNSVVQEFVSKALAAAGVQGVADVISVLDKEKDAKFETIVMINTDSKDVISSNKNIEGFIARRMDESVYQISENLKKALRPFSNSNDIRVYVYKHRYVYVKLDILRILGLMFKVNPRTHQIAVPEFMRVGKGYVMTVLKSTRFQSTENNDSLFGVVNEILDRERD
jgi:hypothetical protein